MMKEANIVQLYSPDGTEAYPITSEHLVRDDNGNEIIGILREETRANKNTLDIHTIQTKELLEGLKNGYVEYELTWIENEKVVSTGKFISQDGWKRTTYVDICDAEKIFVPSSFSVNDLPDSFLYTAVWFDENHKSIEDMSLEQMLLDYTVPPTNAKYFVISYSPMSLNIPIAKICELKEGFRTTASGQYSHAEGDRSIASGECAHAEGNGSTASGVCSHAEGQGTTALGKYSHAEGNFTKASGDFSHTSGSYTQATHSCQYAVGCGNDPQADSLFEVGNGLNAEGNLIDDTTTAFQLKTRRNAFRVTNTGYAIAQTALQIGETAITEDQLKQLIQLITNAG